MAYYTPKRDFRNEYPTKRPRVDNMYQQPPFLDNRGQYGQTSFSDNRGQYNQGGQYGQPAQYNYGGGSNVQMDAYGNGSRTIYLGNIEVSANPTDIIDKVKGGSLENFRYMPDKKCAFVQFLDTSSAMAFFTLAATSPITVNGRVLKVGWGKPYPLKSEIANAVVGGATRNVFMGGIDETVSEQSIRNDLERFGEIDKINIVQAKKIAFCHFLDINSAISAVENLPTQETWRNRRVNYGPDRCARDGKSGGGYGDMGGMGGMTTAHSLPGVPNAVMDRFEGSSRTVYLGGVPEDTTPTEIFDVIKGGPVDNLKILPEKKCAFITFVNPNDAMTCHRIATFGRDGLVIREQKIRLGWGKPSPITPLILSALTRGGTRNVYLGGVEEDISEEKIRDDLGQYGEIERVDLLPDKKIGFVNFTSIASASKAINQLKTDTFYGKYKINFGKDRCARF